MERIAESWVGGEGEEIGRVDCYGCVQTGSGTRLDGR